MPALVCRGSPRPSICGKQKAGKVHLWLSVCPYGRAGRSQNKDKPLNWRSCRQKYQCSFDYTETDTRWCGVKKEKGSQKSIKAANVKYSQSIYSLKPGGITGILGWGGGGGKGLNGTSLFQTAHTHTLTKWQQHQFLCNQNPGMKTLVSETGRVCSLARSLTDQ